MPILESLERTVIARTHEFVTDWWRDSRRLPFGKAVAQAERKLWGTLPDAEQQREAFRKVAIAIRVGYGHMEANPRPLIEIVHRVMRR